MHPTNQRTPREQVVASLPMRLSALAERTVSIAVSAATIMRPHRVACFINIFFLTLFGYLQERTLASLSGIPHLKI